MFFTVYARPQNTHLGVWSVIKRPAAVSHNFLIGFSVLADPVWSGFNSASSVPTSGGACIPSRAIMVSESCRDWVQIVYKNKINTAIYIYTYIYIYIYMSFWQFCYFFSSERHECSTLPPDVGALGSDTLHCWLFFRNWSYESVPMDRGIILCFRRKVGFDLFFTSQIQLVWENTDFHVDDLFAKIHHHDVRKKALMFWRKALISWEGRLFSGGGRLFFWDSHCGHMVSFNSVNCANSVFQ